MTDVYSGGTVRGNVCFKIAKNDAWTLMLYTEEDANARALGILPKIKRVWFALR